jgi:hypothetical protein
MMMGYHHMNPHHPFLNPEGREMDDKEEEDEDMMEEDGKSEKSQ